MPQGCSRILPIDPPGTSLRSDLPLPLHRSQARLPHRRSLFVWSDVDLSSGVRHLRVGALVCRCAPPGGCRHRKVDVDIREVLPGTGPVDRAQPWPLRSQTRVDDVLPDVSNTPPLGCAASLQLAGNTCRVGQPSSAFPHRVALVTLLTIHALVAHNSLNSHGLE